MSTTIDSKVVEMKFQNSNFQKNVKESMNTLDKFKEKLDLQKHVKGFDELGKAANSLSFNSLNQSIEGVKSGFSALELIAIGALTRIGQKIADTALTLANEFTLKQVTEGFAEYELKMNSVQTIMSGTGESLEVVMEALQDLNHYADKTIYIFSDMTSNIGKFTNAGVKLDVAVAAMKGISNEAALSGASAMEASRAMYNIAQALGTGYMQLIDWKSIENANMATMEFKNNLIETAKELGTLSKNTNVTAENFRESLRDKWLTSDVMLKTLEKYADESTDLGKRAFAAAQDVKTFSQMMDTLKEAAGSGWADTFEILIGNFDQAKKLFTKLSDIFGGIIEQSTEARNSLLKGALNEATVTEEAWLKVGETGRNLNAMEQELIQTAKEEGVRIDELIEKHGSFAATLSEGWLTASIFKKTLTRITTYTKDGAKAFDTMSNSLEGLESVVDKVIRGNFGNGAERVKKLTDAGYDYSLVQSMVNEKIRTGTINFENYSEAQLKAMGYTEDQIDELQRFINQVYDSDDAYSQLLNTFYKPTGRELALHGLQNVLENFLNICHAIKEAWHEIFPPMTSDRLYDIIKAFKDFTEATKFTEEELDKIKRSFKGLFAVLDIIRIVAGGVLGALFRATAKVLDSMNISILDITASVGDNIVKLRDWIKEHDYLTKALTKVLTWLADAIIALKDFGVELWKLPAVQEKIKKLSDIFGKLFENISKKLPDGKNKLKEFVSFLDQLTFQDIVNGFKSFKDSVADFIDNVKLKGVSGALSDFKNSLEEHCPSVFHFLEGIKEKFKALGDFISSTFPGIKEKVVDFGHGIKDAFNAIIQWIGPVNSLGDLIVLVSNILKILTAASLVKAILKFIKVFKQLKEVFKAVQGWIKAQTIKTYAKSLMFLAAAVFLMAKAIKEIADIDTGKLWICVGAISALAGVMTAVAIALSKFSGTGGIAQSLGASLNSLVFIAMAGSLLLIVSAIKKLDGLDTNNIKKNLGIVLEIAVIMLAMVAIITLLSSKSKGINSSWLTILAMAVGLYTIVNALEKLENVNPEKIKNNVKELKGVFIALGVLFAVSALSGKNAGKVGIAIIAMAFAVKMLVSSILLLGMMKTSTLVKGLNAIKDIFEIFIEVMMFSKLAGKNAKEGGAMILKMSAALLLIVVCMKLLSGMSEEDLNKSLKAISIISTIFGGLMAVTALMGTKGGSIKAKAAVIKSLVAVIAVMTAAVVVLAFVPEEALKKSITAMMYIMGSLAVVLLALGTMKTNKGASKLVAVTAIVGIIAGLFITLAAMNPSNTLEVATAISEVLLALAASVRIMASGKTMTKQRLERTVAMLLQLTLVMAAIGGVLYLLQNITNPAGTVVLATAISEVLIAMSACIAILANSKTMSKEKLERTKSILGTLTLIFVAVGTVLAVLGNITNPAGTVVLATAISEVLSVMSACVLILSSGKTMSKEKLERTKKILGTLTAIFAAVATVLAVLGNITDPAGTAVLATTVSEVLIAMSACVLILSESKSMSDSKLKNVLKSLGVLTLVFAGIAGIFALFNKDITNIEGVLALATGASMVLAVLSACTVIVSKAGEINESALVGIAVMGVVAAGLIGVLSYFSTSEVDPVSALALATGVSELLVALSGSFYILAQAGKTGLKSEIEGIAGFEAFIISMGLIMAAYGALNEMAGGSITAWIDSAIPALQSLGQGIGEFVGGLVGGVLSGFSSTLPDIADDLSDFMTRLQPFLDGLGQLSLGALEAGFSLIGLLLAFTGAELLQGLADFLGGITGTQVSMSDFADQLNEFAKGIIKFNKTVSKANLNTDAINAAANAGKVLAGFMDNLPRDGGLWQDLVGHIDLKQFSKDIGDFANGIIKFNKKVKNVQFSESSIQAAANCGLILANLEEGLTKHDGLWQSIFGDCDLKRFSKDIGDFADGIIAFNDKIKESPIDADAIEATANSGKLLSELENSLRGHDGLMQKLSGDNDLSKFGSGLEAFGQGIRKFNDSLLLWTNTSTGESMSAINLDSLKDAVEGGKKLAELENSLGKIGGVVGFFSGNKQSLSAFGDQISLFGKGIAGFSTNVSSSNYTAMEKGLGFVERLVAALDIMKNGSTGAVLVFAQNLADLSKLKMEEILSAFTDSQSKIVSAVENVLTWISDAFANQTSLNKISASIDDIFKKTIIPKFESYTGGKDDNERTDTMYNIGDLLAEALIHGFHDRMLNFNMETPVSTLQGMIGLLLNYSENNTEEFMLIGTNIVDGIILGMKSKLKDVTQAGYDIGTSAKDGAMKALDEHSPSKVFYKIGAFAGQGLINAFGDYEGKVYKASNNIGDKAKEGLSSAVEKIVAMMDSDMDLTPTITPVLDLSEVKEGFTGLNSMFTKNQALSANYGINKRLVAAQNQNGANSENNTTTVNYTQNNYSPKALSRYDIYRQTRNQLSQMKGVVKTK